MATITELEDTVPGKLSFLDYTWAVFGYIIWVFSKPLEIFREIFQTKQDQERETNVQPEKLILVRRERNWIDNCCHDNGFRHDHKNTSNSCVTSIGDVLKLLGRQFKQVYSGLYESCQTPLGTTFSHATVMNLLQSPNRASYEPNSNYERIMAKMTRLQDNGNFDAFDKYSSALLGYYGNKNPDITTAVLVEQSRCMLYRNRLAQAKLLARASRELATSTACPAIYIARACLVLSACYRGKGKLGKAKMFLDEAWQNLVNTKYYEDWCRYYDAYGSYLNGISDTVTQPGETVLESAKECFFKQLQVAESCETRKKQQFYALLKMARTLLDANTIFGQQREVPADDVTKAGEYLDKIEAELWEDVGRGSHIQFLLIRVKQYYRQQRYDEAVVLLKKCIAMTTGQGYERDRALMVDGLTMLKSIAELQKSKISSKEELDDKCDSLSGGGSHLESFDSASDSVRVFDSEFDDSC